LNLPGDKFRISSFLRLRPALTAIKCGREE
jgi:hypothetical protein